jgi:hypothetical protein
MGQQEMHLMISAVAKPMLARRQAAALYCRASTTDQTCARQERDLRAFARKACYTKVVEVWKETASGAKAGARRTDPLGPLDARSAPHAADLQTWDVSLASRLVAQTAGSLICVAHRGKGVVFGRRPRQGRGVKLG